ncbi:unnamed protein product [Enterobius vermicularis]|uniref:Uncharacterized protein n=1 Tax=Enterobius vermicularis TaxID=51028 RepID=A0A0N4UTE9_ENTVE|nr:unnamed protein product [Enterobius vermicularis]
MIIILTCLALIFICAKVKKKSNKIEVVEEPKIGNGTYEVSPTWWETKNSAQGRVALNSDFTTQRAPLTLCQSVNTSPTGSVVSSSVRSESSSNGRTRSTAQFSDQSRTFSEQPQSPKQTPQSYSEWRNRIMKNRRDDLDRTSSIRDNVGDMIGGQLAEVRSITEIYRSAEMRTAIGDDIRKSVDDERLNDSYAKTSCNYQNVNRLARCVEKIRGFGPRKLTEQELGRWRQLITKDVHLQNAIVAAKTYQQLEAVVNEQQYRNLFTKEKWANILRCIAESELDSGGLICGRNTLTTSDNQQINYCESENIAGLELLLSTGGTGKLYEVIG